MFTDKDLKQFSEKGLSPEKIKQQIENFKTEFPYVNIIKPATINDGIIKLNDQKAKEYTDIYKTYVSEEKPLKFVPASGAASRMFKALFEYKDGNINTNDSVDQFFEEIEKFAFYKELRNQCEKNNITKDDKQKILEILLEAKGMNYGNLPKGLLKFHNYHDHERTAAEEHLAEGAAYACHNGFVNIHFTVSPEHLDAFKKHTEQKKIIFEQKHHVKYHINFSVQKPATDTIAVDLNNEPFRNAAGSILFRPGGHGALIENLNDLEADIIFVKNIDNIVPDSLKKDTILYKKALAGLLITLREKIFNNITQLKNNPTEQLIDQIKKLLEKDLYIKLDSQFSNRSFEEKIKYLIRKLNRPIRVCGMVKNEGEPGGGPFFVEKESGSVSLQIVEGAQINMNDPDKKNIVNRSTHFNPVDLILAVKNYKGEYFNLLDYVDPQTGFISEKSKDGKTLKAQELPGLWNGAMADWITLFVEVPISTFNPVKTVNDLLRDTHQ